MIRAEMVDGSFIRVSPRGLDLLLRNGRIRRFLRTSGWATIGVDPIRISPPPGGYSGPERRHNWAPPASSLPR